MTIAPGLMIPDAQLTAIGQMQVPKVKPKSDEHLRVNWSGKFENADRLAESIEDFYVLG